MKITKRKDGRYQCNVYLGSDPITGKRLQKTVSAKTKSGDPLLNLRPYIPVISTYL